MRGVKAGTMQDLAPVLDAWVQLVEDYCSLYAGQDTPYWYGEMTTVSSVVCAVGRAGGLALAEASDQRAYAGGTPRRARADLWFRNQTQEYLTEAKWSWPNLGPRAWSFEGVEADLQRACLEVSCLLSLQPAVMGFGSVFVTPRSQRGQAPAPASLQGFLDELLETVPHQFAAWCFPAGASTVRSTVTDRNYPGVIWLGRVVNSEDDEI